jgi:hypothetical protein
MTNDNLSDAERIVIGLDPVQDEQLYDLDDLWRVFRRLGHDPSDNIPRPSGMAYRGHAHWMIVMVG